MAFLLGLSANNLSRIGKFSAEFSNVNILFETEEGISVPLMDTLCIFCCGADPFLVYDSLLSTREGEKIPSKLTIDDLFWKRREDGSLFYVEGSVGRDLFEPGKATKKRIFVESRHPNDLLFRVRVEDDERVIRLHENFSSFLYSNSFTIGKTPNSSLDGYTIVEESKGGNKVSKSLCRVIRLNFSDPRANSLEAGNLSKVYNVYLMGREIREKFLEEFDNLYSRQFVEKGSLYPIYYSGGMRFFVGVKGRDRLELASNVDYRIPFYACLSLIHSSREYHVDSVLLIEGIDGERDEESLRRIVGVVSKVSERIQVFVSTRNRDLESLFREEKRKNPLLRGGVRTIWLGPNL